MFENILSNIKAHLYERVSNPLVFTFVISWLLWNHLTIMVFFSSDPLIQKFNFIHYNIYQTLGDSILLLFIYPILSTYIYIYILPPLSLIVYRKWRKDQKKIFDARDDIEKNRLLTVEESRQIKLDLYKVRDNSLEEQHRLIEELDLIKKSHKEEIEHLNEIIRDHEKYANSAANIIPSTTNVVSENLELLNKKFTNNSSYTLDNNILMFINHEGETSLNHIAKQFGISLEKVTVKSHRYYEEGYIRYIESDTSEIFIYLTEKGSKHIYELTNDIPF